MKSRIRVEQIPFFVLFGLLLSYLSFTYCIHSVHAAVIRSVEEELTVSVSIPATKENTNPLITPSPTPPIESKKKFFRLFGYSSPGARISIDNPGLHNETFCNIDGYFEFKQLLTDWYKEDICLTAQDEFSRVSQPVCVPPLDPLSTNDSLGPILMPPTTSISIGSAFVGDSVVLTGQTIPNAPVQLASFTDASYINKIIAAFPHIHPALAYSIPQVELLSDKRGNYSIRLPTSSSQFIRMFTRAFYKENPTPRSNSLSLEIYPLWMILIKFILTLFDQLRRRWIDILILTQLYFLTLFIINKLFHPRLIIHKKLHKSPQRTMGPSPRPQTALALRHVELLWLPKDIVIRQ